MLVFLNLIFIYKAGVLLLDSSWVLAKILDIWKMSRACNQIGCMKAPTKKITVAGRSILTKEKRELASIYFCTEHYNNGLQPIINTLKDACSKEIKIEKTVKEIGCITH